MRSVFVILLILFFYSPLLLFAQKENNVWIVEKTPGYFNDYTVTSSYFLDFNKPYPEIQEKSHAPYGWDLFVAAGFETQNASVCNSDGKLLFAVIGNRIFDKNTEAVPNTFNHQEYPLNSNILINFIAQKPKNPNLYYVISSLNIPPIIISDSSSNLEMTVYSEFDMSLNGGKGDITVGIKDIPLLINDTQLNNSFNFSYWSFLIKGICNEAWYLCLDIDTLEGANSFGTVLLAYKISEYGLDATPIVAKRFNVPITYFPSHLGKFLFAHVGEDGYKLFHFNPNTAQLEDPISLQVERSYNNPVLYWMATYSLDNKFLFAVEDNTIYQFDLSSDDETTINASKKKIFTNNTGNISQIKMGPDNKLYVLVYGLSETSVYGNTRLLQISGDFESEEKLVVRAHWDKYNRMGFLPNMAITFPEGDIFRPAQEKIVCTAADSIKLRGEYNAQYYVWSTGDTTATIYGRAGEVYWVQSYLCDAVYYDTFIVRMPQASETGIDSLPTTICAGASIQLSAKNETGEAYAWSNSRFQKIGENAQTQANVYYSNEIIYLDETDQYGCQHRDSVVFSTYPCCGLLLPNSFTPNGDGLNDRFGVVVDADKRIETFHIYDRWGTLVFKSNDAYDTWDGTYLGKALPAGVYYYILSYRCYETEPPLKTLKGDVTLIR